MFIVVFLAIHPFQDGNGRLSRLLTTLLLSKAGYLYVPYSSLESVIELNKESYYLALRRTQGSLKSDQPNFDPWLMFFLRSLQKQKIHLEKKVSTERRMNLHMSELSGQILALIREHGRMTISDILSVTHVNRNTLKKQLADLVTNSHIVKLGKGKATWYVLP